MKKIVGNRKKKKIKKKEKKKENLEHERGAGAEDLKKAGGGIV